MATKYKVLGQTAPVAVTATPLYTVPAATSAVVSTLTVANRGVDSYFRVAIRPAGAALANVHYLAYDVALAPHDTILLTLGLTLAATDVVSVYAGTGELSFGLYGSEMT